MKMSIHSKVFGGMNFEPTTLVELLRWRAINYSNERAYTWLQDTNANEIRLSYADLDKKARAIGAWLQSMGVSGERALLIYPPGLEYVVAFIGCLYAGVVAVPAYPPDPTRLNRTLPRLQVIANDAQAKIALTTDSILSMIKIMRFGSKVTDSLEKVPFLKKFGSSINSYLSKRSAIVNAKDLGELKWLSTEGISNNLADEWSYPNINSGTLAFLQYTSGSTGTPRGVMLSHENLLYNLALIYEGLIFNSDCEGVIWLPIYHDMGLIGGVLQPLYAGIACTLMSPIDFLQRPLRWLNAISRIKDKPVVSGGPNFAYDLCIRKVTQEQRESLDLHNWVVAFSGAEPVRPATIDQFFETFKSCGFRREAFYPCYGLAEATLFVSGGKQNEPPIFLNIRKSEIKNNKIVEVLNTEEDSYTAVGCGYTQGDQKIVIVNPETFKESNPGEVGEIWISGVSVAKGYWNRPQETQETFHAYIADGGEGPFLRTGDLGFIKDGELFITGRLKDLIIIRGKNHYPQDIELTVEQSHPALRPGCGAAFSVDVANEECLVIVQEVRRNRKYDLDSIVESIRQAVVETYEIHPYAVVLIEPRTIPKTSSGKIQRRTCKAEYLAGKLKVVNSSILSKSEFLIEEDGITREALLTVSLEERQALIESHLLNQAAKVLKVEPSHLNTKQPLISFGIDSLMAIEFAAEIESTLDIELPLERMLQGATINEIASILSTDLIASAKSTKTVTTSISKPIEPDFTEHPLSAGQKALWFLHNLSPENTAYNIVRLARIRTKLDVHALKNTFQKIIDRHAALRTTFTTRNEESVQIVHKYMEVCFQHEDASNWSSEYLNSCFKAEVYRPFDLENGPLMKAYLYSKSPTDHYVLVAIHHIISDLWSLAILLNELAMLYAAEKSGEKLSFAPLELEYTDYVNEQTEMLAGEEGERLWAYWKKQLSGDLPVLNLPTDRPRSSKQIYHGKIQTFKLEEELTRRIKLFCREQGVTLYMALLAAFQVLLYRYTGQEDIIVGSPKLGRSRKFLQLAGYFVNPIALRGDLSGNPTFFSFLHQLQQTVLEAFKYGDYPLALLVERLNPSRYLNYSPIFQVMFSLQKTTKFIDSENFAPFILGETGGKIELAEITLESLAISDKATPFELSMLVAEQGKELLVGIEYSYDLFNDRTIKQMLVHYHKLLDGIINNPIQRISALPFLSDDEQNLLLREWNKPKTIFSRIQNKRIHQLFEDQVEKTPNAIAVSYDKDELSYQALNQQANQLAHYLQELGTGPEVLVGVYMERTLDAIIALMAIFKAGGAYLPLDPDYPKERLAFIIEDSNVSVILTQSQLMGLLPENSFRIICMDSDGESIAQQSTDNPISRTTMDNLAYVIYTSGSTGKPKGVLISHDSIANHCFYMKHFYELTENDCVLQFASFNFDASLEQILPPLIAGARLILRGAEVWSPAEFQTKITDYGLTVINPPTAYWNQLNQAWDGSNGLDVTGQLRLVIVGGDLMTVDSLKLWRRTKLNSTKLLNAYGPTETTITSTIFEVPAQVNGDEFYNGVPIGRPLELRSIYILDQQSNPIPAGVPGELYIGGACVARGYLNRPDLTAERFIPDPFSSEPGARLYKTGDMVRYLVDGNIEFLGRVDQQVKIRGYRIELGEIDAVLNQHPKVREGVVVAKDDLSGDKRLVAYYVGDPDLIQTELRNFLREKLPDYMIPTVFMSLDELPKTPIGKMDRKALPAPDQDRLDLSKTYIAPTNPVEQMIADLWAEVLGVECVGIYDNFFDLGGHSLMATQIITRIKNTLQVDIPLRKLFDMPTVANLALVVAKAQTEQIDAEQLNGLLDELEELSDEEVKNLLSEGVES